MAIETLVGTTLAGYTVRGKVGEGGTSTVFRAEHATHGTVALKVLREKLQHDKTAVARFLREAQFGARVEHPNIVRTLDYGQSDSERYYLAIEWAGGDILDKFAEKSGPLPSKDVYGILSQICSAVQAAHDVGIVHRDLKPENVMYDSATHHVKVLDFGIAADTDAAPDQRLTRAGFFVGTLMYVAPESLSGELVGPVHRQVAARAVFPAPHAAAGRAQQGQAQSGLPGGRRECRHEGALQAPWRSVPHGQKLLGRLCGRRRNHRDGQPQQRAERQPLGQPVGWCRAGRHGR